MLLNLTENNRHDNGFFWPMKSIVFDASAILCILNIICVLEFLFFQASLTESVSILVPGQTILGAKSYEGGGEHVEACS